MLSCWAPKIFTKNTPNSRITLEQTDLERLASMPRSIKSNEQSNFHARWKEPERINTSADHLYVRNKVIFESNQVHALADIARGITSKPAALVHWVRDAEARPTRGWSSELDRVEG